MKFFKNLLGLKPASTPKPIKPLVKVNEENQAKATEAKSVKLQVIAEASDASDAEMLKAAAKIAAEANTKAAPVNIWDIEGGDANTEVPGKETSAKRRRRRTQTRVLGFTPPEEDALSTFDKAAKVVPTARAKFPVGWVLVTDGPGRGECFTLEAGMSQIGRADDQAINLDFGDNSISRVNHAAIVYDADTHTFILGHGGKKNIVRLNGKPVISNEEIANGDKVHIGETTLLFVALCTDEFNWDNDNTQSEEEDNVAIA